MDRLARFGDASEEAAGVRARAAILAAGYPFLADFARATGQKPAALGNSLNGSSYPSRQTMLYLHRVYELEPSFIMIGSYAKMPADLRSRIFAALAAAESAPGQSSKSD